MEVIVTSKAELTELIRTLLHEELSKLRAPGTDETPKELLSLEECAELTGFAGSTIYGKVSSGTIPYSKKNGRLFFFRSEILEWIRQGDKTVVDLPLRVAEERLSKAYRRQKRA